MVPVFAFGPQAELFSGIYDNTAIYDKFREAFGFKGNGREIIKKYRVKINLITFR